MRAGLGVCCLIVRGSLATVRGLLGVGLCLAALGNSLCAVATGTVDNATSAPPDAATFATWLSEFSRQARDAGITDSTLRSAFADVRFNPKVVERDRHQPEFTRSLWQYLDLAVSKERIREGRKRLSTHRVLLEAIRDRYGVAPEYVVAIWGLETNYGGNLGGFNTVEALATLAYDGRRREFARRELLATLRLLQQEGLEPQILQGSWAGAIGHTQFLPSTYLRYAVDQDGDGLRDLWNSVADALGSAANYLAESGWQDGQPWGLEVVLPEDFSWDLSDSRVRKPMEQWIELGVRGQAGRPLPDRRVSGSLLIPAGYQGPAFLTMGNFLAIKRYNPSTAYALGIGHLADRFAGGGPFAATWPIQTRPLSRSEKEHLQRALQRHGYDVGGVDGMIGPRTRAALRAYQKDAGVPADGYPTPELLHTLQNL